jgi:hypothetical protein
MPIDDISRVTRAIRDLLEAKVSPFFSSDPDTDQTVTTTSVSPQAVTSTDSDNPNIISVYLFHMIEDPQFKNLPPSSGSGPVPASLSPLALVLYYVITAHNPVLEPPDARAMHEQKLLGLAAKVIHDAPVLKADGDDIEVILRPVSIEEAVNFWSNDEQHLTRASFFIEARVAFLQPEPPTTVPGIVLEVDSFVLVGFGPQLSTSKSALTITPPARPEQTLNAEPARVALFEPANPLTIPPPPGQPNDGGPDRNVPAVFRDNNRLRIEGVDFGRGPHVLEFESGTVRFGVALDSVAPENSFWELDIVSGAITLRFWTSVFDSIKNLPIPRDPVLPETEPTPPLLPGLYTVRLVNDEAVRPLTSNAIAFTVIAQINDVEEVSANVFDIHVDGTYLQEPGVTPIRFRTGLQIQLVVGGELLALGTTATPDPGTYVLAAADTIQFHRTPVAGELVNDQHPLAVNLIINGANATPAWIMVP